MENTKKKMGRPTVDPRGKRFELRLSETTYQELEECANKLNISKADVVHKGISMVFETLKNEKEL